MYRAIVEDLKAWKIDEKRKPLMLQGARQVGKTFLVKKFAEEHYQNFIYVNFEQDPGLHVFFEGKLDPHEILEKLGLYLRKNISPESSLIFFDEIQAMPKAITSLKYFFEEAPEYHLIAAGSLLGVSLGRDVSFPVGKVSFLTLFPMSFYEYLLAAGEGALVEHVQKLKPEDSFESVFHDRLIDHLKRYFFLGGMPEVVAHYLEFQDVRRVRKQQKDILAAYRRDFKKYASRSQAIKNTEVWDTIPRQLSRENKKFKYNEVKANGRASMYDQSLDWLASAGLVHRAYLVERPMLPLSGYADFSKFKVYLHDVGLLGALLGATSKMFVTPGKAFQEYNGAFVENFIAQELRAYGAEDLYYWTSRHEAEVDFLLQVGEDVLPVEVKSGLNRNVKSLRSYEEKYHPKHLVRMSPRNFIRSENFSNLPLYAAFLLKGRLDQLVKENPDAKAEPGLVFVNR